MAIFEGLHRAGNTIVLITHEAHVANHARRIIHMKDGAIEREETNAPPAGVRQLYAQSK